jgi:hypothetical protein
MIRTVPDGEDGDDHTVIDRRDPLVGAILDQRFRVESQLAAGGFGAITGKTPFAGARTTT